MKVNKGFMGGESEFYNWSIAARNMFEVRRKFKISQADLAETFGWSLSAVSYYEMCKSYPRIDYVIAFCDYFGISIEDLFKEDLMKELN